MSNVDTEPQKPSGDEVIWRYISAQHFLDLFAEFDDHKSWESAPANSSVRFPSPGQFWFSFPRAFGCHWEGRLPYANETALDYCQRMAEADGPSNDEFEIRLARLETPEASWIRQCNIAFAKLCGVSCWTQNAPGSAGMWSFTAGSRGVAIRSTVDRVLNAIATIPRSPARKTRVSATKVGYIEHQSWFLKSDGYRSILACINIEHRIENEIRFIADSPRLSQIERKIPVSLTPFEARTILNPQERCLHLEAILREANMAINFYSSANADGFHLPVNLEGLIDQVVFDSGEVYDDIFEAKRQM